MDQQQKLVHQEIIGMNTDAIGLMLEGQQDEALGLFQSALDKAQKCFDADLSELRGTSASTAYSCLFEVSMDEVIYPIDCTESASPDNCFRMYRQVFAIDDMQGSNNFIALHKVLAVVAYNLGLIYHECGLACLNSEMLLRAQCLYNVSVAIVESREVREKRDTSLIPFEMALYNNLGHLHGINDDRDGASTCLRHIKDMLEESAVLGDDADSFFQTSYNPHSHLNKAPAA